MDQNELLEDFGIRKLVYSYAHAADALDEAEFAACFAKGGRLTAANYTGDLLSGDFVPAVIDNMRTKYLRTMHNVQNYSYAINDTRAKGTTYCVASHIERASDGSLSNFEMYICYHDDLVKQNGRWLFERREVEIIFTTATPAGNISPRRS